MATATTSAPQQQVAMPALDLRRFLGVVIGSEGVQASADLRVTQRAAGANMSVDVAAGEAFIADDHGSGGGFYHAVWTATENVAIGAADPSNPRIDRVTLRIRDAYLGDAANDITLVVVAGTPTVGANLSNLSGAAAVPGSSLLLANALVGAGVTSITDANIDTDTSARPILALAGQTIPAGAVIPYAVASAPTGYLLCDGSAVSRTTYEALFAAIGTTFGVGDGSTTFNLPDMRGRVPAGYAASGGHSDVSTLGNSDGVAAASRRPTHGHTSGTIHTGHGADAPAPTGSSNFGSVQSGTIRVGPTGMDDTPAYLVLNYIIKT